MNDSQRKAMFAKINGSTSEKDIIKLIKGGSKNFSDWYRNETNELAYQEIERRNREIPRPKLVRVGTIFRDDPKAIEKMSQKIENVMKEQEYWKQITKFPVRDYHHHNQLGDAKFYELGLTSTKLREAKKKLEKLQSNKKEGVTLQRNTTYKGGKPRFYYSQHDKEGKKIE